MSKPIILVPGDNAGISARVRRALVTTAIVMAATPTGADTFVIRPAREDPERLVFESYSPDRGFNPPRRSRVTGIARQRRKSRKSKRS